jgi:hypothetical protein
MEESLKSVSTDIIEEAIGRLCAEKPELNLIIDNVKEALVKAGKFILKAWEKVKEFFLNMSNQFSQTYNRIKPLIEYYGNQQKRMNYKENLHSFLGTNQYQRNKTFSRSSIYYKNGKR